MSGKSPKEKARSLIFNPKSHPALLKKLILDDFFDSPVSSKDVVRRVKEKFGKRWKTNHVHTYMNKFMQEDIIHAVKPAGNTINFWILTTIRREQAIRLIGKKQKVIEIEEKLFSESLMLRLKKDFSQELEELHDNFGKNGNCTAFLLRKILEKLIFLTFAKNKREKLLEDKSKPGKLTGLENMIEIAAREKLDGIPFLVPKTANAIRGIKFLGDVAAHNPLASVEINTILPQMPYIITAYEELAKRL